MRYIARFNDDAGITLGIQLYKGLIISISARSQTRTVRQFCRSFTLTAIMSRTLLLYFSVSICPLGRIHLRAWQLFPLTGEP